MYPELAVDAEEIERDEDEYEETSPEEVESEEHEAESELSVSCLLYLDAFSRFIRL
jgi:hypothetical protein